MSDFFDKALLLGAGLESKLKELACELQSSGKQARAKNEDAEKEACDSDTASETEGLGAKERVENKLVTEGVKGIKELLNLLKEGKDKVEGEVSGVADTIADKMGLATVSELTTVKEMARVAREKVDALEKRLEKLEEDN
jgi:BMFP domain-containing protein YqiC